MGHLRIFSATAKVKGFGGGGFGLKSPSAAAPVAATGAITFTGNPNDADTLTVGGVTYTFRADGSNTSPDVGIGEDNNFLSTTSHLVDHINEDTATTLCGATDNGDGTITLTANSTGAGGNSITLTESAANLTVTPFHGGS
jgi:phage tail sheath gpL-like